jgi:phage portal protein BeeE
MSIKDWFLKAIMQYAYTQFDVLPGRGRQRSTDARALIEHNKSWVYVCASRNAETIAGIPLKLYVRGGTRKYYQREAVPPITKAYLRQTTRKAVGDVEEVVDGHPLVDLLNFVNGDMTRPELIELSVTYQEITGDAYWYLEPGPLKLPQAVWPLMSQYVKIVRDAEGRCWRYCTFDGATRALQVEEVRE